MYSGERRAIRGEGSRIGHQTPKWSQIQTGGKTSCSGRLNLDHKDVIRAWPWWRYALALVVYILFGGGWLVVALLLNVWAGLLVLGVIVALMVADVISGKGKGSLGPIQLRSLWRESDLQPETPLQRAIGATLTVIGWQVLILAVVAGVCSLRQ